MPRWTSFEEFFEAATGYPPFDFQTRLAQMAHLPKLVEAPTGAGKTLALVLSWLWRRFFHPDPDVRALTPRRLVYCLPMRVLVEQTASEVQRSLQRLGLLAEANSPDKIGFQNSMTAAVSVYVIMGGEPPTDWHLHPEQAAVLIGTQDMLLSGALNRAYGSTRFRWPQTFAILNNDVLWAVDEIQLTGVGLSTTTQLDAFRRKLHTYGPTHTLWMSATVSPKWLETVDHPMPTQSECLGLSAADRDHPILSKRLRAPKRLEVRSLTVAPQDRKYTRQLAEMIASEHRTGSTTLVILNTVGRATATYEALKALFAGLSGKDGKGDSLPSLPPVTLIHSRFRPTERRKKLDSLPLQQAATANDHIIISTQVIEAGVDLSAATLITELAPWPSLVQRFGRCNRYGELPDGRVFVIDLDPKHSAPYAPELLTTSRQIIYDIDGRSASPSDLPHGEMEIQTGDVIRQKDLIDLFDTTPDLTGNDLDVSRYIRESGDTDVQVFWRHWGDGAPPARMDRPRMEELCPVPLADLRASLKDNALPMWTWNHLDEAWKQVRPREVRPGGIYLLPCSAGRYSPETGWSPHLIDVHVEPIPEKLNEEKRSEEGMSDEHLSFRHAWLTIPEHTDDVCREMELILAALPGLLDSESIEALQISARYHDSGKNHPAFQAMLTKNQSPPPLPSPNGQASGWAKSPAQGGRNPRPHFRHELASALALLEHGHPFPDHYPELVRNLVAYLCASHHGRVRMSIRTLPDESLPPESPPGGRVALGVADGDTLPETFLGGGIFIPCTVLTLDPMELGGGSDKPSWTEMALSLRDSLGPFRLAFLEAILRSADSIASRGEREVTANNDAQILDTERRVPA